MEKDKVASLEIIPIYLTNCGMTREEMNTHHCVYFIHSKTETS